MADERDPNVPGRIWLIVIAAVLLALAIPLFYAVTGAVVGLGGAAVSNVGAIIFMVAIATVIAALSGGVIYIYRRAERARLLRDDAGNTILSEGEAPPVGVMAMTVQDVMKANPVVCGTLDSVSDCAREMYEHNVGYLVVLDDKDQCVGVISDRDLVCGGIAQGMDPKTTPISMIMERNFRYLRPDQSFRDCIRLMQAEGIRRVPVLEGDKIVGLVSLDDLIVGRQCSIDDAAMILLTQLSEPNAQHGLSAVKMSDNRAA